MANNFCFSVMLMACLVLLSAGIAGCTSTTPAAVPVADKNLSMTDPSGLIVQPQEIPGNFTLVAKGERGAYEMSGWAREHGWKKGYYAVYRKNDQNSSSGTVIRQNISIYAPQNATLAVSDTIDEFADWIVKENAMNQSVEKLSITPIGDASGSLRYVNKDDNAGTYVIAFAKNGVFEDIETNGTAADYETARQLATIAAAKIR